MASTPFTRPASRRPALVHAPGLKRVFARSPALEERLRRLNDSVSIAVAIKNRSGERIQAQRGKLARRDVHDFAPHEDVRGRALEDLQSHGFKIDHVGRFSTTVSGSAELVCDVLGGKPLVVQTRPRRSLARATQNFAHSWTTPRPDDVFVTPADSLTQPARFSEYIDDLVFIPPPQSFAPIESSPPPLPFHGVDRARVRALLDVPDDLRGDGIELAVIDSGFAEHPYYTANGFAYRPEVGAEEDLTGHGTAMAANVFMVAPGAVVHGVRRGEQPHDAVERAQALGVQIISCSWGWDFEQSFPLVEVALRHAIDQGVILIFASGNGEQAWPASMREVISVGGVFWNEAHELEASNYASGFASNLYPGRLVPDICGLCGQRPKAIYLMLPCPPGCALERENRGGAFPDGDQTAGNDGWVGTSGTSSAAAQIAGVVALMLQKARNTGRQLRPNKCQEFLQRAGRAVARGANAQGIPAADHQPNAAVGFGLVQARDAISLVDQL